MDLRLAIKDFLLEITVRKYTKKTVTSYRLNLKTFEAFCKEIAGVSEIEEVTPAVVRSYVKYNVERGRKGTYINSLLKTLKSFLQYCYDEGLGGFNTRKNFNFWVKEEKTIIVPFTREQVLHMLRQCHGNGYVPIRDRAILTVLFETGIRCWELCCIQPQDIHEDYIIINGKGHKQRVAPITPLLRKELLRYEIKRDDYFALKTIDDYYFLSFHGRQLTNSAVEHIIKRYSEGMEGVRASPHTCRHTFAQQQLKMGTDVYTISRLLGHESLKITQVYLRSLSDQELIETTKNNSVLMNLK